MRKFLSLFLVAVLVLSSLCLPAVALEGDGTATQNPNPYGFGAVPNGYTPEGTPITSLDQITDGAGKYYLAADISVDLSATTPDAPGVTTFTGVLDGYGHKITYSGSKTISGSGGILFAYIQDGGTLKNLVIDAPSVTSTGTGGQNLGIIARGVSSGTVYLENVAVTNASFYQTAAKGNDNAGGFFGDLNASMVAKDCSIHVTVTDAATSGGALFGAFCGIVRKNAASITMTNCHVVAGSSIQVRRHAAGFIANVAAFVYDISLTNCSNEASITSVASQAGGLVGCCTAAAGSSFEFINCVNTGAVSALSSSGGIFAQQGTNSGSTFLFDGCVNAGTVEASNHRAAGIAAHIGPDDNNITMQNCINFGAISNTAVEADVEAHETYWVLDAAAFIASAQVKETEGVKNAVVVIKDNYNFGTITGWDYKTETTGEGENAVTTVTATKRDTNQLVDTDWVFNTTTMENNVDVPTSGLTEIAVDSALLHVLEGARIRVALADQADSGLRYDIATNETLLDKLAASANDGGLGYTVTVGSIFAKAETLGNNTSFLGINAVSAVHQNLADVAFKADGTYSAALTGFATEQYTTQFVCGGFIQVTIGNTTYTIHSMAGSKRSVAEVANAALGDTTVNYTAYLDVLNTFAGN